ncbi:MAG: DMT family transporter, partial [Pyramidobacter sp.]|nr:DMT family transporter [Pyramidobacter sp.]
WRSASVFFFALPQYFAVRQRGAEAAPFFGPDRMRAAMMVFTGFFVLTLPGWLVAYAMQRIPAAVVSPVTGSSPMVAALFSALLFREKIAPMQWLGIVMIIGGGAMVSLL